LYPSDVRSLHYVFLRKRSTISKWIKKLFCFQHILAVDPNVGWLWWSHACHFFLRSVRERVGIDFKSAQWILGVLTPYFDWILAQGCHCEIKFFTVKFFELVTHLLSHRKWLVDNVPIIVVEFNILSLLHRLHIFVKAHAKVVFSSAPFDKLLIPPVDIEPVLVSSPM